jgi:hypothetical protein
MAARAMRIYRITRADSIVTAMRMRRCDEGMNFSSIFCCKAAITLRRMNVIELQGHRIAVTTENGSVTAHSCDARSMR